MYVNSLNTHTENATRLIPIYDKSEANLLCDYYAAFVFDIHMRAKQFLGSLQQSLEVTLNSQKQFHRSIVVASSRTRPTRGISSRRCY